MASPPRRSARAAARLVALAALVAGGCDTGDGRELQHPAPGATAPPLPTSSSATSAPAAGPAVGSESAATLALTSPAFGEGSAIPARYASCDGDNVSPPLAWAGVPAGTVELALVVRDPDAPDGDFVHWVVTGLSPGLAAIGEGAVPDGAVEARNDTSEYGWFGPCPPAGETHRYTFTLYALGSPSGVAPGADGADAIAAVEASSMAAATLTATFGNPG